MSNQTVNDGLETGQTADGQDRNTFEQILADADKQIDAEQYENALQILHYGLRQPDFDVRVYEKCAFVLRMSGQYTAAELFEAVVADRDNPEPLFRLGYQLVQDGLYGPALGPLSRCVKLAPESSAANYEFAYALMKEFYNEAALHYFAKAYEQEQAMSILFYMAQLLIFLGRSGEAWLFMQKLEEQVKEAGEGEPQLAYLKGMLRRYRAHQPQTIRDWHFVQYGSLLLRTYEEDDPEPPNPANGRYTLVNFGYPQVAAVLAALQAILGRIDLFPPYKYIAAAGEASAPIAHALGQLLTVPVKPLAEGLSSGQNGIVITSFSDELQGIAEHVWDRKDVLLFSFALSWTHDQNVLPEVVGYLAQMPRLPWQERVVLNESGEPVLVAADERPAEAIAGDILHCVAQVDADWVKRVCDFYGKRKSDIIAGKRIEVPRKRFFTHSALGGARY
ncbi:tetratricopeptide repeat protein [Effusibacillus pohliae]|uniref:tetratricopeptide repeat protein n=1 Tax=Effusibacillus pohliae TaxID=232270 RepID=UPI0003746196|nr:hypothetical protein [Effusibacillus pohliae]